MGRFRKGPALSFGHGNQHSGLMELRETVDEWARAGRAAEACNMLLARHRVGDGEAALTLAHWHIIGQFVPRDLAKAREYFAIAAERGQTAAEAPLVALLGSGAGGLSRDWPDALQRFETMGNKDQTVAHQVALIARMDIDALGDPNVRFDPEFVARDPLIVLFREFMSGAECEALIALASPSLAPAQVVDPDSALLISDPVRDSSSAAFPFLEENPFVHALNRRIASASRSKPEQGEPMQVLAYGPGQQYRLHSDALASVDNQRIQTFLVYLTEDFDGGATYFPHGDLALRPSRGDAICFSNVTADMRPAANARHAGLPVMRGRKLILSKWIRQVPLHVWRSR